MLSACQLPGVINAIFNTSLADINPGESVLVTCNSTFKFKNSNKTNIKLVCQRDGSYVSDTSGTPGVLPECVKST